MMRMPPKSPTSYGKCSFGHTMNIKLRGTPSLVEICATTDGENRPCTNTRSITIWKQQAETTSIRPPGRACTSRRQRWRRIITPSATDHTAGRHRGERAILSRRAAPQAERITRTLLNIWYTQIGHTQINDRKKFCLFNI